MNPDPATMTIGTLAKVVGVGVETVRYYQRRGLLPVPPSPSEGFRRYGPDTLERLQGIKRAQHAGFTLAEIAVLLRLDRVRDRRAAHDVAVRKIAHIDSQIAALQELRKALGDLTRACEEGATDVPCPILEAIRAPATDARRAREPKR